MGLLDQVLGQVIGGMMGGGGRQEAPRGSGAPTGGGLGDILGQLGGQGGKYSPLVLALLALLASKNLGSGAGGYGTILHDIFGKLTGGGGAPAGPMGMPQEDEPAQPPARRGRSGGGGFMNEIGSMLDGPGGAPAGRAPAARDEAPAARGGGLDDLLQDFIRNGHGDTMRSWMGAGPNQPIAPDQLDQALGRGTVDDLVRATGGDRDDLLRQLSQALPEVVDRLTPDGRLPSREEQAGWL